MASSGFAQVKIIMKEKTHACTQKRCVRGTLRWYVNFITQKAFVIFTVREITGEMKVFYFPTMAGECGAIGCDVSYVVGCEGMWLECIIWLPLQAFSSRFSWLEFSSLVKRQGYKILMVLPWHLSALNGRELQNSDSVTMARIR
jgi:hypothetical protein